MKTIERQFKSYLRKAYKTPRAFSRNYRPEVRQAFYVGALTTMALFSELAVKRISRKEFDRQFMSVGEELLRELKE